MATIANLLVRIGADIGDLERKMSAAERAVNQLGQRMNAAGRTLTVGLTTPLALAGGAAVSAAAQMDSLTRGLTAVMGSAEGAQAEIQRLQITARLPGLGFREAIQGSIALQSAGFSADLARRSLEAFGNALATVGKGKAELDGVTLALQQIASRGKISAEEINQLQGRVPQIRAAIKAAFGTADTTELQKAGIGAQEFVERVVAQLARLPQATGGAQNGFENLADSVFRLRVAIGNQLLPVVIPLVERLARLAESAASVDPALLRSRIALVGMVAVAGPAIVAIGSLTTAITGLVAAGAALAPVLAVGGAIAVGLGFLTKRFLENKLAGLGAASAADQFAEKLRKMDRPQTVATLREVQRRIEALKELQPTEFVVGAINDLGAQRQQLLQQLAAMRSTSGAPYTLPTTVEDALKQERLVVTQLTATYDELAARKQEVAALTLAQGEGERLAASLAAKAAAAPVGSALQTGLLELERQLAEKIQIPLQIEVPAERVSELRRQLEAEDFAITPRVVIDTSDIAEQIAAAERRAKQAAELRRRAGEAAGLDLSYKKAGDYSAAIRARDAAEQAPQNLFQKLLGQSAAQIVAQFGPLAVAAAALRPVFEGLNRVLGPTLAALAGPLGTVGQILGQLIVPVLRLTFPVLQGFALAVAVVAEGAARLASAFLTVIGGLKIGLGELILGLGKLLGPLGGKVRDYGRHLIEGGEEILNRARAASDLADQFEETQRTLRDLKFDELAGNLDRLNEAVVNTVSGFKVAAYRFAATGPAAPYPVGGGAAPPSGGGGSSGGGGGGGGEVNVTVNIGGGDRERRETYRQFYQELDQKTRGDADARAFFLALPAPV